MGMELPDDDCSEPVNAAQLFNVLGTGCEESMPKKYVLVS
jgi:hypothetical protein